MLSLRHAIPLRDVRAPAQRLAFFALFYFCVWLLIDPSLIYESNRITVRFPAFERGWDFFQTFLAYPGGPTAYLAAFLGQLYYYPWVGAAIITASAWILVLAAGSVIKLVSGAEPRGVHFLPAILLAALGARYAFTLDTCTAITAAALAACFYAWLPLRRLSLRFLVFLFLSWALYYVAAEGYLPFVALCAVFEAAKGRQLLAGMSLIGAAAVPPALGIYVMQLRPAEALAALLPARTALLWQTQVLLIALCAFYPLIALIAAARRAFRSRRALAPGQFTGAAGPPTAPTASALRWVLETATVCLVGAAAVCFSFNAGSKALLRIEWSARRELWGDLLRAARRVPPEDYNPGVCWDVNRALFHAGLLPYDMFAYPQGSGSLMPSKELSERPERPELPDLAYMKFSGILLDLGRVNEAELMTYQALEVLGNYPAIIRNLALISMFKQQPEAARILLGKLSKDVIYAAWARGLLTRLAADPELSSDPDVQRTRSFMIAKDYVEAIPFERLFLELLERNKHNRMAFEYLMADFLLSRRLEKVAVNIGRLDDFGYPDIPRHYEEALLIYAATGAHPDLHGRHISPATVERFAAFSRLLARYKNNQAAALKALAPDYGNTYFFYYAFGTSGWPQ